MWVTLTDCDNGQACDVVAASVVGIRILDETHTLVLVAGAQPLEVRESRWKVRQLVSEALMGLVPTLRAREIER